MAPESIAGIRGRTLGAVVDERAARARPKFTVFQGVVREKIRSSVPGVAC